MNFEKFIKQIHKKGWMIVAMNEYSQSYIAHLYLVVKKTSGNECVKVEGTIMNSPTDEPYTDLFEEAFEKISEVKEDG